MKLSERCTTWVRGMQCTNLRLFGYHKCALHASPKPER